MSVSYCSTECQNNDFNFHQEKCSAMETLEDWDETCVESPDARMGLTGNLIFFNHIDRFKKFEKFLLYEQFDLMLKSCYWPYLLFSPW